MKGKGILITSIAALLGAAPIQAADFTWAGSTTGLGGGADQTWDTNTTANWWDGVGFVNWPALGGTNDDAIFGGTAGTVTITTATANDLTFNVSGYTLSGGTLTLNGSTPTITVGSGNGATISSVINGSSGLVKVGGGVLTLSGNNSYTGVTTVSGGTLGLSGTNTNGNLRVNGAGAMASITGGATTLASTSGDTYVTGGGTLEIAGGSLVIQGGAAYFPVGAHPAIPGGDGTLTITSGSFTNNNSWGIVLGEANTGTGTININGGVFTADDTSNNAGIIIFKGVVNLNGGTLIADRIGGNGPGTVNFNGGKLQATGHNADVFPNNGNITTTIQAGGLKVGGTPSFTISEVMAGTGGITKEDGNTVTLTAANGYSGGTTLSGGAINVGNNSALGSGTVTMNGGTLTASGASRTLSNTIQIDGSGSVFNAPTGADLVLNGNMTGSGSVSVAGQWAVGLGGNNSGFTGTWTSGSENPNNITRFDTANSGSASAAWVLNGGRMINSLGSSPTISLGSLSGTGGILSNNTGGQVTYSIGGLNTNTTFSGQIHNQWGGGGTTAITKTGNGTLTLSGNLIYTGNTTVSGGTLTFARTADHGYSTSSIINNADVIFSPTNNAAMYFDSRLSGSGTFTVDGPGGGNIYQNRVVLKGTATASDNTGPINVINSGRLWLETANAMVAPSTVINLNGAATVLTFYGTGTRTIGGLNSTGGNGTVDLLDVGGGTPSLTIGAGNVSSSFSGVIKNTVGSLSVTKTGTGTLTLSGNNTYSGVTTVSGGTLALSGTNANGNLRVNGAGALARITGGTTTLASNDGNTYVTGGGTLEIDGGSLVIQGGAAFFPVGDHPAIPDGNGTLTLTSGSFTNNNSWGIVVGEGNAGTGTINVNGGAFTANDTSNNTGIYLGVLAGGNGTLNLNGGTLIADRIQGGGGTGTVNFNGGKLQATGDIADIFPNNGNVTTTILAGGIKVGGAPNFTISEPLAGTGGLTKEDGNTVTLTGTNSYSGATLVSAGTLLVSGNISGSAVTVSSGATIGGSGTLGALTANNGSFVAPGSSPGVLSAGNTVLSSGSTLSIEINGLNLGSDYDQLSVTGTVDITGATLSLSGTYLTTPAITNDLFTILLNDGNSDAVVGTFAGLAEGAHVFSGLGQDFTISYIGGDGNDIILTAVPEPGTAVSLLGGLGLLLGLRRRRA